MKKIDAELRLQMQAIENLDQRISRIEDRFVGVEISRMERAVDLRRLKADFDLLVDYVHAERKDIPAKTKYVRKRAKK